MRNFLRIAMFSLLLFASIAVAQDVGPEPQTNGPSETSGQNVHAALDALGSVSLGELAQQNCGTDWIGKEAQVACREAWQGFFQYARDGYIHRKGVFQKQYWLSYGIFFVAVALVFLGIYFAWIQFNLSMQSRLKPDASGGAALDDLKTELSLSKSEIKVNSPVLGVIILIISLAFFYMYLVFVFPVHDTF